MYQVYSNFAPDTLNDTFEKKKKTKYLITLGTIVILFQEILNLYIMDQKQTIFGTQNMEY